MATALRSVRLGREGNKQLLRISPFKEKGRISKALPFSFVLIH